jgi:hypothetical protein
MLLNNCYYSAAFIMPKIQVLAKIRLLLTCREGNAIIPLILIFSNNGEFMEIIDFWRYIDEGKCYYTVS